MGTDSATGAIMMTPTFVGADDFHLLTASVPNLDCCVDRRSPGPSLDVDGSARPRGPGFDIGAHEGE